jgi:general secretion pathway protein D
MKFIGNLLSVCLLSMVLSACNSINQIVKTNDSDFINEIQEKIPEANDPHGADYHLSEGINLLASGETEEAAQHFNSGLKYDPKNSNLHFLNALIYQQHADAGDTTQFELAEVGYQLALKFEPNHWLAAYQLGKLYLGQRQFRRAQNEFSRGLLIEPKNPSITYGLAVASYAIGDVETASVALNNLPSNYQQHPAVLRANTLTFAALDDNNTANQYLNKYRDSGAEPWRVEQVTRRLNSWDSFHQQNKPQVEQIALNDLAYNDMNENSSMNDGFDMNQPSDMSGSNDIQTEDDMESIVRKEKMIILDAIILLQEKSIATTTGINLLSGLSIMFSGNILDYARNRINNDVTNTSSTNTTQHNTSLTMSIPAVTYSLNIANAQDGQNKLLARPSVLAYEGNQSELFIGTEVTYTTPGNLGGGNSYDKEIGLQLRVRPDSIEKEFIKMSVYTEFDSVVPTSAPGTFTQSIATAKTTTSVDAEMQFGQTIMIGAGTSKQTSETTNGVPVLKDIPLLRNLFNTDSTSDRETSLIVLITPRKPVRLDKNTGELDNLLDQHYTETYSGSPELEALRKRHKIWWRPTSNVLKVLESLKDSDILNEFRSGDIKFTDLDENLSTKGSKESPVPEGIIRTLVSNMYF